MGLELCGFKCLLTFIRIYCIKVINKMLVFFFWSLLFSCWCEHKNTCVLSLLFFFFRKKIFLIFFCFVYECKDFFDSLFIINCKKMGIYTLQLFLQLFMQRKEKYWIFIGPLKIFNFLFYEKYLWFLLWILSLNQRMAIN